MYKAVLFDLDGTLLHTIPDIADAMNTVLEAHGFAPRDEPEYNYIIGGGARVCVENACPEGTPDEIIDAVLTKFRDYYDENYCIATKLYSGIANLINGLRERGLRLAVVTNKTESTSLKLIEKLFDMGTFEYVLGNSDKYQPKPAPDIGLYACDLMSISPSEVVYLGDSGSDMVFGKNAGFYPVGVLWGYREKEELQNAGAAAVIEYPEKLLELELF